MTNFRIVFSDNNGDINTGFETVNTDNFLVAERIIRKRIKSLGGVLLQCEAWFE